MKDWRWMTAAALIAALGLWAPTPALGQVVVEDDVVEVEDDVIGEEIARRPGEYCGICESKKRLNDLAEWLSIGADARLRFIWDQNVLFLNGDSEAQMRFWQRFRARTWAKITPFADEEELGNVAFNVRLTWEFFNYCSPRRLRTPAGTLAKTPWDTHFRHTNLNEVIFDQFNIEIDQPGDMPLALTLGRQDIRLGDGWLVLDGTPLDGSRTIYFDAVRATIDMEDAQSTLDVIYLNQQPDTDTFIRPFNDRDWQVTENAENGFILYLINKTDEQTQIDAYYIYKSESRFGGIDNDSLHTIGTRIAGDVDPDQVMQYRVEVAPQWGKRMGEDRGALGVNSRFQYNLQDEMKNYVHVDYEYRSGGESPGDAFDILWGRWPQWSNIVLGWLDRSETEAAALGNFHRVAFGWGCVPIEDVKAKVAYSLLFADRNDHDTVNPVMFSRAGKFRGHLVTASLDHKIDEHFSHQVVGEMFAPGNYYTKRANDIALWVWYQINFSW